MMLKALRPNPESLLCRRRYICKWQTRTQVSVQDTLCALSERIAWINRATIICIIALLLTFVNSYKSVFALLYLLLSSDPSTIRLSSRMVRISVVSAAFSISSPLSLNVIKLKVWLDHTSFTCDNLASISFSFTADMQMSYSINAKEVKLRRVNKTIRLNIVLRNYY